MTARYADTIGIQKGYGKATVVVLRSFNLFVTVCFFAGGSSVAVDGFGCCPEFGFFLRS